MRTESEIKERIRLLNEVRENFIERNMTECAKKCVGKILLLEWVLEREGSDV